MMDLEKILELSRTELTRLLGDNLLSLLVCGSVPIGDFRAGSSDINLLAVLKRVDLEALAATREFIKKMAKHKVSAPLLLTDEQIKTSADVFPLEFLELQEKHRVLQGEDPLALLAIGLGNLRHECEHELKGRLIRLRQSYLEIGSRPRVLQSLLKAAENANYPVFRGCLRLKKMKPPLKKEEVLTALAQAFGLSFKILLEARQLRLGQIRLGLPGLTRLFGLYLEEVEKLAQAVDRI